MSENVLEGVSNEYLIDEYKKLRVSIDACIQVAKGKHGQMLNRYGTDAAKTALDKLIEGKMWCGKVLEALDHPFPEYYRDEYKGE